MILSYQQIAKFRAKIKTRSRYNNEIKKHMQSKIRSFKPIWPQIPITEQIWREQLGTKPLVIEIGPGVGLHPILFAKQNPEKFIVGIERTTEKFQKFAGRVEHHPELNNIYPVHADAVEWVSSNILPNEVSAYFLLYPNPYPKAAQKNKRLMHMPFMQYLIETMQVGATITLATNMQFFYAEAKELWQQIACFKLIDDRILYPQADIPRTHFERKYLAAGQDCYQLVFAKI